jgi:type 1 glutamine amidotransferase
MNRVFWLFILCAAVAFGAEPAASPRVVLMIGEDEYMTWETLPEFAKTELEPRGVRVTVIHADKADTHSFPGVIDALRDADVLVLSVRRRTPPKEQLDAVRAFLDAGRALIGIRTASHAFALRAKAPGVTPPLSTWADFDPEVLGGHYTGHHGPGSKTAVSASPGAEKSPLLEGVDVSRLEGNGSLYQVSPLHESCTPLLVGTIPGKPSEPVAWTRLHGPKQARIFYTSLGHPDDFKEPQFRRMLLNATVWAAQIPLKAVEK